MISFPYDSKITGHDEHGNPLYDRGITAEQLREFNKRLYSTGIYMADDSSCFKVEANGGMTIKVKAGAGHANGVIFYNKTDEILEVPKLFGTNLKRIDLVVLEVNTSEAIRSVRLKIKQGVASVQPQMPLLTRDINIFELAVAQILVDSNSTSIISNALFDLRLNNEFCGVATARPQELDTTRLFEEYRRALDEYMQTVEEALDGTLATNLSLRVSKLEQDISTRGNLNGKVLSDVFFDYIGIVDDFYCYRYKNNEVTESHFADVVLSTDNLRKYDPIKVETINGAVFVYCNEKPSIELLISSVVLIKEVS